MSNFEDNKNIPYTIKKMVKYYLGFGDNKPIVYEALPPVAEVNHSAELTPTHQAPISGNTKTLRNLSTDALLQYVLQEKKSLNTALTKKSSVAPKAPTV